MPTPTARPRRRAGFTIQDLLVVIVLIAVVFWIQIPVDAASRRTARRMQNSTQLRGIHQGLVVYANANKNNFPGLMANGNVLADSKENTGNSGNGDTVQARFWILLDGDFMTPEYIISPSETAEVTVAFDWAVDDGPGKVLWDNKVKHYSYAMLGFTGKPGQAPDAATAGRAAEWRQTLNSQAIVLSDRNTGTDADKKVSSIWTDGPGDWRGAVLWNDNHVAFENTHYFETKYANGQLHTDDFDAGTDNLYSSEKDPGGKVGVDALMVIAGNDTVHAGE